MVTYADKDNVGTTASPEPKPAASLSAIDHNQPKLLNISLETMQHLNYQEKL